MIFGLVLLEVKERHAGAGRCFAPVPYQVPAPFILLSRGHYQGGYTAGRYSAASLANVSIRYFLPVSFSMSLTSSSIFTRSVLPVFVFFE